MASVKLVDAQGRELPRRMAGFHVGYRTDDTEEGTTTTDAVASCEVERERYDSVSLGWLKDDDSGEVK